MPIAIKMAGKEIASYDTTTDKVAIKLSDDVSINDSAGNVVLGNSGLTSNVDMSNVDMSNVVFPAIGQLAFWHGYSGPSSNINFTLDGVSSYTVIFNCRYNSHPYFPMNLTMIVNSANGTISNKTRSWVELSESFNNSTKVLTLSGDSTVDTMSILIFRGAITEGT